MTFFQTYWFIWVALAIVAIVGVILYQYRGWAEQKALASAMGTLSQNEYSVVESLGVRCDTGVVTIERVIPSIYGVFVVSTFPYRGRIDGEEDQAIWKHSDKRSSAAFDNPVAANAKAIRVMRKALADYPDVPFVSIVGFPSRDILNVKATAQVTYMDKIMDVIRSYQTQVLSIPDAKGIAHALNAVDVNNTSDEAVLSDMI